MTSHSVSQLLISLGVTKSHSRPHVSNDNPLWHRSGETPGNEIYRKAIRAIRAEYGERRGLNVRIKPWEIDPDGGLATLRRQEGFEHNRQLTPYRTFVLDLAYGLEEIHAGMARKWRRDLSRARARGLVAETAADREGIDAFIELYRGLQSRKGFTDFSAIDWIRDCYLDLPAKLKPRVTLCRHDGEVVRGSSSRRLVTAHWHCSEPIA